MSWNQFHPAVKSWFEKSFGHATEIQLGAWTAVDKEQHTLIAAPTGSGKTLAAFLNAINQLVENGLKAPLPDKVQVVYISPLKALSNDIEKNLHQPLCGIRDRLFELSHGDVPIRTAVRTGDTSQSERQAMKRVPPHILVTTPESFYLLLTSASGREMLSDVKTVIVDEIHALAGDKRGAHLTLSLERLAALTPRPPLRVGISATQKPIEQIAHFLVGGSNTPCEIVNTGYTRKRDIEMVLPGSPLEAVMSAEVWSELYESLAEQIEAHRTTLIFVNTRRLAERLARHLAERIGEEQITTHHGSLSKEHRLRAETLLKQGELRALVATASLELGIDIGDIDLVCQLGSPHSIATFLQRVGRASHTVDGVPKGRLYPLSRDELVECTALLHAVQLGELDAIQIPSAPLDVLAQQIVAEVGSAGEWPQQALFDLVCGAWPYRELTEEKFNQILHTLADGYTTKRGRRSAYLHWDRVNNIVRARKGAQLTALTNGGVIPDQFDSDVVLLPEGLKIGTLNEDFAFESLPGDIFQLGNLSYRIRKVEGGRVWVEDAKGLPSTIPFWFGEAAGRTDELSYAVSRLRAEMNQRLSVGIEQAQLWLQQTIGIADSAAAQLTQYLAAVKAALTQIPDQQHIVFERFFDETGDMHFVIHSPFGSRLNRAWGLALRKRFCQQFNFELQAAALEDSIVLSLGVTHSFPITEPAHYLKAASVKEVLIQALLDAPMFPIRWRWVVTTALAVHRMRGGKRHPPQFQRNDAEDLMALIFPDQIACLENIVGRREVPDHPLVDQAIADCTQELMDLNGLIEVLKKIETNEIKIIGRDLNTPSPLSQEILNAKPYAFLDDGDAEARRTLAIQDNRDLNILQAAASGALQPDATAQVQQEAWPQPRSAEELHDALMVYGFFIESELISRLEQHTWEHWQLWLQELQVAQRMTTILLESDLYWVATERSAEFQLVFPDAQLQNSIPHLPTHHTDASEAKLSLLRSRLECLGPITKPQLANHFAMPLSDLEQALLLLEQEGFAIRGQFSTPGEQWCERRLAARIHRYARQRKRQRSQLVSPQTYMRFLFRWHGIDAAEHQGRDALLSIVEKLEGFPIAAGAWEQEILKPRMKFYDSQWLDSLCGSGEIVWHRAPRTTKRKQGTAAPPVRTTPFTLMLRSHRAAWLTPRETSSEEYSLSSPALRVHEVLQHQGACFFIDLLEQTGLLRTQLEEALGELVALGLITADGFSGIRALVGSAKQKRAMQRNRRRQKISSLEAAGRWCLVPAYQPENSITSDASTEQQIWTLLLRYGVLCRALILREKSLPNWREILYVCQRLEARGEILGGRFIDGLGGEQFALAEAAEALIHLHRQPSTEKLVIISAADPLNLTQSFSTDPVSPRAFSHRIAYLDGVPVAVWKEGDIHYVRDLGQDKNRTVREAFTVFTKQITQQTTRSSSVDYDQDLLSKIRNFP